MATVWSNFSRDSRLSFWRSERIRVNSSSSFGCWPSPVRFFSDESVGRLSSTLIVSFGGELGSHRLAPSHNFYVVEMAVNSNNRVGSLARRAKREQPCRPPVLGRVPYIRAFANVWEDGQRISLLPASLSLALRISLLHLATSSPSASDRTRSDTNRGPSSLQNPG